MDNKCGSCTACCRIYAIPELAKPAGKWCDHCDIGKGCKIYDDRPTPCVTFECYWLQSQSKAPVPMPVELRPDRCKVVFAPSTNEYIMVATTMPGAPFAYQRKIVMDRIHLLNRIGVSVAVGPPNATHQIMFLADGTTKVVRMTPPDKDGMQWSIKE